MPAFRPIGADRDQLEAVRSAFARAHGFRCDTNNVPLSRLDDLVVVLNPTGAAQDNVDLFLFAMAVAGG